ncbi:MAG: hypothetical protein ABW049_01920 [Spongiibacteraceae bacterium]
MNRILCAALILTFAFVQSLSLHAHLPHAYDTHPTQIDHDSIHVHSHATDAGSDDVHEYSDAVQIDLLAATATRAQSGPPLTFALTTVWALILIVLWVCISRRPLPSPPACFAPPPHRRPSPRAPPR